MQSRTEACVMGAPTRGLLLRSVLMYRIFDGDLITRNRWTLRDYTDFEIEILNERADEDGILSGDQHDISGMSQAEASPPSSDVDYSQTSGVSQLPGQRTALCASSDSGGLRRRRGWMEQPFIEVADVLLLLLLRASSLHSVSEHPSKVKEAAGRRALYCA